MTTALMVFHAFISLLMILMVLLQFGKGAEAGLISGGASDAVFSGSQQGNILSKITTVLAIIFFANCIYLAKLQSSKTGTSILDSETPIARPLNQDAAIDAAKQKEAAAADAKEQKAATPAPTATPAKKK
ncbi:MAG: preprotein translocase subunit SecG [Bacteriovoracaceae bacterium]|nr:preprotein translocase subunit SecG [Bacteriovoracaceae bacterium]